MRSIITHIALIIPLIPPILIIYSSNNLITQYLGIAILIITIALGINGLIRGKIITESLFSFISMLIITILDEGYIPILTHIYLFPIQNNIPLINTSVVLTEYSIIIAQLSDFLRKYEKELITKGYEKDVVNEVMAKFATWTIALSTIAMLISVGIYLVLTIKLLYIIDPFTALLIFTVAYLIIVRYLYNKISSESKS